MLSIYVNSVHSGYIIDGLKTFFIFVRVCEKLLNLEMFLDSVFLYVCVNIDFAIS